MRIATAVVALLAMISCDPLFGVYVRQSFAPAPASGCIASALDSSPAVVEWAVVGEGADQRFRVFFRDSLFHNVRPAAYLVVRTAEAGELLISMEREYCCGADVGPDEEIVHHAAVLLPEIRRACSLRPAGSLTCETTGFFGKRSCIVPEGDEP